MVKAILFAYEIISNAFKCTIINILLFCNVFFFCFTQILLQHTTIHGVSSPCHRGCANRYLRSSSFSSSLFRSSRLTWTCSLNLTSSKIAKNSSGARSSFALRVRVPISQLAPPSSSWEGGVLPSAKLWETQVWRGRRRGGCWDERELGRGWKALGQGEAGHQWVQARLLAERHWWKMGLVISGKKGGWLDREWKVSAKSAWTKVEMARKKRAMRLVEDVSGKRDTQDGGTSSCSLHRFTLTNPQRAQSLWEMRRGRSHWRGDRASYHPPEREWWRGLNLAKKRRGIQAAAPARILLDPEGGCAGWAALLSPSSTRRSNPNLWRFQRWGNKLQDRNRTPQRDRVCAGAGSLEQSVVLIQGWMELKTRPNAPQEGKVWVFDRKLLMV